MKNLITKFRNRGIKWHIRSGAARFDPEKTLLPTVILVLDYNDPDKFEHTGFSLNAGWWHYYIAFTVGWLRSK